MKSFPKIEVPKDILDFYRELISIQNSHSPLVKLDLENVNLENQLSQGKALINSGSTLDFELEDFNNILSEIIELIKKHRPGKGEKLSQIEEYLEKAKEEELRELIFNFLFQNTEALEKFFQVQDLNEELTSFVIVNSLKPFIKVTAEGLKNLEELKDYKSNTCPICGWKPLMSKVIKDHQRLLHCSLCDFEWEFKNLKCVDCGNEDHESLEFFTVDGIEGHKVNVCKKCNGYIKVLDANERILSKDMLLEDIQTIYLDLLAEKEGYKKQK